MVLETQASTPCSSPYLYVTDPTSPNACSRNNSMEFYYSAPASPRRKTGLEESQCASNGQGSSLDDFEFETSKKFSGQMNFDSGITYEFEVNDCDQSRERKQKYRERGDSLPAMAFADELFMNGLVMPLKLPPRLQYDSDSKSFGHKSPVLSPKSPRTVFRLPFARKNSWNDNFDPFMVALEKVTEEKRGRNGHHRRSRSYSPFRAMPKSSSECTDSSNQDQDSMKINSPTVPVQSKSPKESYSGPLDFKGSAYARWVRDQTREASLSSRWPKSPRGFLFGQRVRPVKTEQEGPDKPGSPEWKCNERSSGNVKEESKVQKLKKFVLRYTSFGREKGGNKKEKMGSGARKASSFSRLSFKHKGNGHSNEKKKGMSADTKMAVVKYKPVKPSMVVCLGYGVGSPQAG